MQTCKAYGHDIQTYAPGDRPDAFWQLAGPVFGSRAAQRELGGPFTDDAWTSWTLAVRGGVLLGLASARVQDGRAALDHAYVRPEHRRQGVHAGLLLARLAVAAEQRVERVQVLANGSSFPALVRLGFLGTGQRGGYTVMVADGAVLRGRLLTSSNYV